MEKLKRTKAQLVDLAIARTYEILGQERPATDPLIPEFRWRDGDPNWDMNCGVAGLPFVAAFARAVDELQQRFELDTTQPS